MLKAAGAKHTTRCAGLKSANLSSGQEHMAPSVQKLSAFSLAHPVHDDVAGNAVTKQDLCACAAAHGLRMLEKVCTHSFILQARNSAIYICQALQISAGGQVETAASWMQLAVHVCHSTQLRKSKLEWYNMRDLLGKLGVQPETGQDIG